MKQRIVFAFAFASLGPLLTGCGGLAPSRAAQTATVMVSHQLCSAVFVSGLGPQVFYREPIEPMFPADSVDAGWGVSHFAEPWYMFDPLNQNAWQWNKADRRLARVLSDNRTHFVRDGNRNAAGLPTWLEFTGSDAQMIRLGDPMRGGGIPNLKQLQVFDTVYEAVRGRPFAASQKLLHETLPTQGCALHRRCAASS